MILPAQLIGQLDLDSIQYPGDRKFRSLIELPNVLSRRPIEYAEALSLVGHKNRSVVAERGTLAGHLARNVSGTARSLTKIVRGEAGNIPFNDEFRHDAPPVMIASSLVEATS